MYSFRTSNLKLGLIQFLTNIIQINNTLSNYMKHTEDLGKLIEHEKT